MEVHVTAPPAPQKSVAVTLTEQEFSQLMEHLYTALVSLPEGKQAKDIFKVWDELTTVAHTYSIPWNNDIYGVDAT